MTLLSWLIVICLAALGGFVGYVIGAILDEYEARLNERSQQED